MRILLPLYIGFLISSIIVFLLGNGGLLEYHKLTKLQDALAENINELTDINGQLNSRLTLLNSDPDTVRLEARSMGYYQEGETRIRIEGFLKDTEYFPIGKLIQFQTRRVNKSVIIRLIGFSVPLCYYIFALIRRFARKKSKSGSVL